MKNHFTAFNLTDELIEEVLRCIGDANKYLVQAWDKEFKTYRSRNKILICSKCNIKLLEHIGFNYFLIGGNNFKPYDFVNLSCDELIIKNILE